MEKLVEIEPEIRRTATGAGDCVPSSGRDDGHCFTGKAKPDDERDPVENTRPEMNVRSWLHRTGIASATQEGSPRKAGRFSPEVQTVYSYTGVFWHRHAGCKKATTPKNNKEFWEKSSQRTWSVIRFAISS